MKLWEIVQQGHESKHFDKEKIISFLKEMPQTTFDKECARYLAYMNFFDSNHGAFATDDADLYKAHKKKFWQLEAFLPDSHPRKVS